MGFDEQNRRSFSPIQYEFSKNRGGYSTYATSVPFVDPMKLHTNHAVTLDIEEYDPKAALGGAVRAFDKLCARLFLAGIRDFKSKVDRYIGETYLYQITKIYQLNNKNEEQEMPVVLESGHIFLPNRPDRNSWQDSETSNFFQKILDFKDPIFNKALKYLYSSSVGHFRLESFEKVALDHFKSIELIINSFSKKESFKQRVDEAAAALGLSTEESEEIKKYWDARSNGDIAHSRYSDPTAFYPNQFPLPSGGMDYPWAHLDRLGRIVLLKYLDVRQRYFHVDIQESTNDSKERVLGVVNEHSECNHLFFETPTKNKKDILKELRKEFGRNFKIDEKELEVQFLDSKLNASVFIKDPKGYAEPNILKRRMIRITF